LFQLRPSRLGECSKVRKKNYFQTALTARACGFSVSLIEGEILDSGDQLKIRVTNTTKYRQLYTVYEDEGTEV